MLKSKNLLWVGLLGMQFSAPLSSLWASASDIIADASKSERRPYVARYDALDLNDIDKGEHIREYVGAFNMASGVEKVSVAHVTFMPGATNIPHYHPKSEEAYLITKGTGKITLDATKLIVKEGDLIIIPAGVIHSFLNDSTDSVEMIVSCGPMWKPDCFVNVGSSQKILPFNPYVVNWREMLLGSQNIGDWRVNLFAGPEIESSQLNGYTLSVLSISSGKNTSSLRDPSAEKTYTILEGEVKAILNGAEVNLYQGDLIVILPGDEFSFENVRGPQAILFETRASIFS